MEMLACYSVSCHTTHGLVLLRATVVVADERVVYKTLVRPESYITDYNMRFSGITARDLSRHATKSSWDVQND
jgi:DNA polymerase III epsilon subunit-like protein